MINKAISSLTNGIVEDLFEEDGMPKLERLNPIQALMVNRFLCMHFKFVKALWSYDKKNSLTNAVFLRILVRGIIKNKIIKRKEDSDYEIKKFSNYVDKTVIQLLKHAELLYERADQNPVQSRSPIFNNKKLIEIAREVGYEIFFSQPVLTRAVEYEWLKVRPSVNKLFCSEARSSEQNMMNKIFRQPRSKLYIHMVMHLLCYVLVACYNLLPKTNGSNVTKWITFMLITSLAIDEIRQAVGERGNIKRCLKQWWSDNWNKLDLFSMVLYYVAFGLDFSEFYASNLLFAMFFFAWILKFYLFLRVFETVGLYTIIVQRMLRHFLNFGIMALVALIGYGVFMTSILFPLEKLDSWNAILLVLIRPYLILFADTGIASFIFSRNSTLFETPKIHIVYEVLTIVGMCVFLMFGGILLMNLLIAVFNGVYEEVKQKSEQLWVINNFHLVHEFRQKPGPPIPFSILQNVMHIVNRIREKNNNSEECFTMGKEQEKVMKSFLDSRQRKTDLEAKLDDVSKKTGQLSNDVSKISRTTAKLSNDVSEISRTTANLNREFTEQRKIIKRMLRGQDKT